MHGITGMWVDVWGKKMHVEYSLHRVTFKHVHCTCTCTCTWYVYIHVHVHVHVYNVHKVHEYAMHIYRYGRCTCTLTHTWKISDGARQANDL